MRYWEEEENRKYRLCGEKENHGSMYESAERGTRREEVGRR